MTTWVLAAFLGVGLAAAAGLRTFLPLLVLSVAAHFGWFGITLHESLAWLGSMPALVALAIATVAELAADLIPYLDNLLSLAGNVTGPVAGALAAAAVFADQDAGTAAITGLIIGAPTALAFSVTQTGTRAASTAVTGGVGNPVLSVLEDAASFLMAVLSIVLPILVPVMLLCMGWLMWRLLRRKPKNLAPGN